jgi:hypothetical protein
MWGKLGRSPKVLYPLVIYPFSPSEHATAVNEMSPLSYSVSYLTVTEYAAGKIAVRGMMNERSLITVFLDKVSVFASPGERRWGRYSTCLDPEPFYTVR